MRIANANFRFTGLATGLDTNQMVQDLMKVERLPLKRLEQQRQMALWRQESYRGFTNALRGFQQKFFDQLRPSSYLLSDNTFKAFSVDSTSSDFISVRGTATAQEGSHTVKVLNLATADRAESTSPVSKPITGTVTDVKLEGKSIRLTLDGVTREIMLSDYDDLDDLIENGTNGLQKLVDQAFGEGKIIVQKNGVQLQLSTAGGASRLTVTYGNTPVTLEALGIEYGTTNRIATTSTLIDLADKLAGELTFDADGKVSFAINGASFSFSENDTLSKVMATINNDARAGVTVRYSEANDTFSITAKQTGAGDNIRITENGGSFFGAFGINALNPVTSAGVDARVMIDDVLVTRNTNTFTVNGLEYTLKKAHAADSPEDTIKVSQNVDAVFDAIKSFVEEYNQLIDRFTTTLSEKYDRKYLPLDEDEKKALSEDEVKKWEERAKTGILRNDPLLQKIQNDMRRALMDSVQGVGINLAAIGIASTSYLDHGKLTINEERLKAAIREKPDEVRNLFKQPSDSVPSYTRNLTAQQRTDRYREQGLFFRIADIIEDNISTFRDLNDNKGFLLQRAGIEGDSSVGLNLITRSIDDFDKRINELYNRLIRREENFYRQFSMLETQMSRMNSQMDWLHSQLGMMYK